MPKTILGIDEVGRGPWAGPLVIGAVILGENFIKFPEYAELTDSKKLTERRRLKLAPFILENAVATGLGWVSSAEIDKYGLSASLRLAARRAVKELSDKLTGGDSPEANSSEREKLPKTPKIHVDEIVIDGTGNFLVGTPLEERVTVMKKADFLVKEVSAASIIAKVARDNYMVELAEKYPGYGFEKHVGYGTAAHKAALEKYGVCPEHRRSFRPVKEIAERLGDDCGVAEKRAVAGMVRTVMSESLNLTSAKTRRLTSTEVGRKAEDAASKYLTQRGHRMVARNYKTSAYEIDVISLCGEEIYFTEVKYSLDLENGSPLERVTSAKQRRMRRAAEGFMADHPELSKYQPILAAASVVGPDFRVVDFVTL